MKIKNTKELRLRANSHARNDHIRQGTYGDGSINGKAEFKGCAVGCLSTPHRKWELFNWIKAKLTGRKYRWSMSRSEALAGLRDEFGITERLAVVAEACFEGKGTHGAAINFVRDFAHACPEGADIQDRHVEAFLRRQGLSKTEARDGRYATLIERLVGLHPEAVGHLDYYERKPLKDEGMEEFTLKFLDWLRGRG